MSAGVMSGGGGGRRRRGGASPVVGINVTSLLDITFVLLIAFMVVTPVLTHTLKVELPRATPPIKDVPVKPPRLITVGIEYGGTPEGPHTLSVDGIPMPDFDAVHLEMMNKQIVEGDVVGLAVDRKVPFGWYVELAAALQRAGIINYQILYEEK